MDTIEAEAFRRIYPAEYLARFLAKGLRPDGRTLLQPRAATLTLGVVTSAQGSALVRLGRTAALAAVKAEIFTPTLDAPASGAAVICVELPPLCSAELRPGRSAEACAPLSARVNAAVEASRCLPLEQLCVVEAKHAWLLRCDVYILDADGGLFEAALAAATAALADTRLPPLAPDLSSPGRLVAVTRGGGGGADADSVGAGHAASAVLAGGAGRTVRLASFPAAASVALVSVESAGATSAPAGGCHALVDPTREEEAVAGCAVSVAVSSSTGHDLCAMLLQCRPGAEDEQGVIGDEAFVSAVSAAAKRQRAWTATLAAAGIVVAEAPPPPPAHEPPQPQLQPGGNAEQMEA